MPSKKVRARILKNELIAREYEKSLSTLNMDELTRYEILSALPIEEVNETEWAEYETLERKRANKEKVAA
jgi:hypothetical protein